MDAVGHPPSFQKLFSELLNLYKISHYHDVTLSFLITNSGLFLFEEIVRIIYLLNVHVRNVRSIFQEKFKIDIPLKFYHTHSIIFFFTINISFRSALNRFIFVTP